MSKFTSFLSAQIESFIAYRTASENWNDSYEFMLTRFDNHCLTNYPGATELSQEMVDGWCKRHDTEKSNSCRTRIYAVYNLIKYLRARGETDVSPPLIPRKERRTYIPHAFTDDELAAFFKACDSLPGTPNRLEIRSRKITIPVFFRLMYSSGIRTNEARLLRTADVDLTHGILNIQRSKGIDQHYVVLHDSMLELMKRYDAAISKLYPDRTYFFPSMKGGYHGKLWLQQNFNRLWAQVSSARATAYTLRHHYAVTNINSWIDVGFGFDDKLLYLSKSMGHRDIEDTKYYYSLVPGMADILEEKTNTDFEDIVPEVDYEEVQQ